MTVIEIILLIAGMLLILGSFWMTEKLSADELEHISELSKEEMGVMLERELKESRHKVVQLVKEEIEAGREPAERALEQQTNEKIMAISEFSDTVIEKMNRTHNEIMFLYSMLNDKHVELTKFSSGLTKQLQDLKEQEEELTNYYLEQLKQHKPQIQAEPVPIKPSPAPAKAAQPKAKNQKAAQAEDMMPAADAMMPQQAEAEPEAETNVRREILKLYGKGMDSVAIAKQLGVGVGEVRLILELYKGDHSGEV